MSGTPTLRIGQFYLFPGGRRQGCFGAAVLYTSSLRKLPPGLFLLSVGQSVGHVALRNSTPPAPIARRAYYSES